MNPKTQQKRTGPEVDGAILGVLTEHRGGEVLTELSAAMREVAEAVQNIGKSGTITLKIKVAVAQGTSNTLVISDEVKTTLPKAERRGSIFYVDPQNNLVRNDPAQHDLPLAIDVTSHARPVEKPVDLAQQTA